MDLEFEQPTSEVPGNCLTHYNIQPTDYSLIDQKLFQSCYELLKMNQTVVGLIGKTGVIWPIISPQNFTAGNKSPLLEALILGFIYLFGVLHYIQHCTGHITKGSWKGRGN